MNDIQVWNNAAFDDRGGNGNGNGNGNEDNSFFPMKTSRSSSECTKENLSPPAPNNSSKKNITATNKNPKGYGFGSDDNNNNNRNIDDEIEEIERKIHRLTTRLDALRLEKAKRGKRVVMGRVVPAKFMEPRPSAVVSRKPEETPKTKVRVSSSSNNNNNAWRRGMSLGPNEIAAATPATTLQSRRKSCYWKIPEISEESRAKTTVGRVKKKEENLVVQVQGKKLFEKEKAKSVCESSKKGRVVASRYNSDVRKRSLPEGGTEIRVKKRWEIPKNGEEEAEAVAVMLPKIKMVKCLNESPRDSGAAKRVAELGGRRSYFNTDEKDVCQILNFAEEEEGQ